MSDQPQAKRWRPRFGFRTMLALMAGIALGFAPLKMWELYRFAQPQVMVHVQVVEVPRAEASELVPGSSRNGWVQRPDSDGTLQRRIDTLCSEGKGKVLCSPTVATNSGSQASITIGGEIPVPVAAGGGTYCVEFLQYGTKLGVLPTLQRNGRISLDIRPEFTVLDQSKAVTVQGIQVPGVLTREYDVQTELESGETTVLGFLADVPTTGVVAENAILILATVERLESRR